MTRYSSKLTIAGIATVVACLVPVVAWCEEPAEAGPAKAEPADPNVLRPTTNELAATPEYNELRQASANVRDILKLAHMLPPGSDASKAIEPTVKEMRDRETAARKEMDALLSSRLMLVGKGIDKKRGEIRAQWIKGLIDDEDTRGKTLYAKVSRFGKVKITEKAPRELETRAATEK